MSRRRGKICDTAKIFFPDILVLKRVWMVGRGYKGLRGYRGRRIGEGSKGNKDGSGGLLRPNEEMIHWNVELICGCQFLFHSEVFMVVRGVCPHHSLDPTSSSTCLGPAQLGSPQPFMASFPLNWEADMQRTIVNAWLQNFTEQRLISSSSPGLPIVPLTWF